MEEQNEDASKAIKEADAKIDRAVAAAEKSKEATAKNKADSEE